MGEQIRLAIIDIKLAMFEFQKKVNPDEFVDFLTELDEEVQTELNHANIAKTKWHKRQEKNTDK